MEGTDEGTEDDVAQAEDEQGVEDQERGSFPASDAHSDWAGPTE